MCAEGLTGRVLVATVSSAESACGVAAITCAGDNSCIVTPLPMSKLIVAPKGLVIGLALLAALLAILIAQYWI